MPRKSSLVVVLVLLIGLLAGVTGSVLSTRAELNRYRGTQFVFNEKSFQIYDYIQLKEQNLDICAYTQCGCRSIMTRLPERSCMVTEYHMLGNEELLPYHVLDQSEQKEDMQGCMIDQKTCYQLYGTVYGCGNTLWIDGKEYRVTSVIQSEEPVCYVYCSDVADTYDRIIVTGQQDTLNHVVTLLKNKGILSNIRYSDTNEEIFYLIRVPIWFIAVLIILMVFIKVKNWKVRGIAALFACVYLLATGFHIYFPDWMVPNKWSNLEFYPQMITERKLIIFQYMKMMQNGFEQEYLNTGYHALFYIAIFMCLELMLVMYSSGILEKMINNKYFKKL